MDLPGQEQEQAGKEQSEVRREMSATAATAAPRFTAKAPKKEEQGFPRAVFGEAGKGAAVCQGV